MLNIILNNYSVLDKNWLIKLRQDKYKTRFLLQRFIQDQDKT